MSRIAKSAGAGGDGGFVKRRVWFGGLALRAGSLILETGDFWRFMNSGFAEMHLFVDKGTAVRGPRPSQPFVFEGRFGYGVFMVWLRLAVWSPFLRTGAGCLLAANCSFKTKLQNPPKT